MLNWLKMIGPRIPQRESREVCAQIKIVMYFMGVTVARCLSVG